MTTEEQIQARRVAPEDMGNHRKFKEQIANAGGVILAPEQRKLVALCLIPNIYEVCGEIQDAESDADITSEAICMKNNSMALNYLYPDLPYNYAGWKEAFGGAFTPEGYANFMQEFTNNRL